MFLKCQAGELVKGKVVKGRLNYVTVKETFEYDETDHSMTLSTAAGELSVKRAVGLSPNAGIKQNLWKHSYSLKT